jgi:hypothetical protein
VARPFPANLQEGRVVRLDVDGHSEGLDGPGHSERGAVQRLKTRAAAAERKQRGVPCSGGAGLGQSLATRLGAITGMGSRNPDPAAASTPSHAISSTCCVAWRGARCGLLARLGRQRAGLGAGAGRALGRHRWTGPSRAQAATLAPHPRPPAPAPTSHAMGLHPRPSSLVKLFEVHEAHALVVHDLPVRCAELRGLLVHVDGRLVLAKQVQRAAHLM